MHDDTFNTFGGKNAFWFCSMVWINRPCVRKKTFYLRSKLWKTMMNSSSKDADDNKILVGRQVSIGLQFHFSPWDQFSFLWTDSAKMNIRINIKAQQTWCQVLNWFYSFTKFLKSSSYQTTERPMIRKLKNQCNYSGVYLVCAFTQVNINRMTEKVNNKYYWTTWKFIFVCCRNHRMDRKLKTLFRRHNWFQF